MHQKPLPRGWRRWFHAQTYDFQPNTPSLRLLKKILIAILGFTVVAVGIVMIATPGPAIIVVPAGLAILAIEFAWARRWLRKLKAFKRIAARRTRRRHHSKNHSRR